MTEVNVGRELYLTAVNPRSYPVLLLMSIAILIIAQPDWIDDAGRGFLIVLFVCTAALPENSIV